MNTNTTFGNSAEEMGDMKTSVEKDTVDKDARFPNSQGVQIETLPWKDHTTEAETPLKDSHLAFKIMKTIFLVSVWITLGMCGEITGPTLLDLKLRTRSNFEDISQGLSGRGVGFFLGAALGGALVDKLGGHVDAVLGLALDALAATIVAIPWMPNTDLLFLMTLLDGTAEGVINIAGQKLILDIWKEKATGPLHFLHGGYGIGSFVIPLVAKPFLAVTEKLSENTTASHDNASYILGVTMTTRMPTTTEVVVKGSSMEYAYYIAAAVSIAVSVVFFVYQVLGINCKTKTRRSNDIDNESPQKVLSLKEMINPATCAGGRFFYGLQILTIVVLFYIQDEGGEVVIGKYVRTYSVKALNFSDDNGTYVNTAYWIAFTVGRLFGLVTGRFIPIRILFMIETGACALTTLMLFIFGDRTLAFWILAPAVGFFIGPLFPSAIGWANFHIEMTGIAITLVMFGCSVGTTAYMSLTGYLLDNVGYEGFLYVLLGLNSSSFVLSAIMNLIGSQHGSRFIQEEEPDETICEKSNDEDDLKFQNQGFEGGLIQ